MCNRSVILAVVVVMGACATRRGLDAPVAPTAASFATPDEAMNALLQSSDDPAHADELLGPGGADVLCSCDAEEGDDLAIVREKLGEKVVYADDGPDRKRVLLGSEGWELPLTLVRVGDRWCFDLGAAADEVLCRSVGDNELRAIATLRELVDAQCEYFAANPDGGERSYARRWCSTPGKRDGLYWESAEGAGQSPLGPGFCRSEEGAASTAPTEPDLSVPFHGYCYRILGVKKAHSSSFAFVAWPSDYCKTGVMSFEVNAVGLVFQKDLGPDTVKLASAIKEYDADGSWTPIRE